MKHLILGGLSSALLATVVTPVIASEEVAAVSDYPTQATSTLLATTLVELAYQGYFAEFGIPGHVSFIHAVAANKIDAETLIESAIAKGRLDNNALSNQEYVSVVDTALHDVAFP
ncbi:hypothetical protein [Crocosphaera chwakensis]|uniref:Hsp33-like chaperonin n=1 Tax=Crocosphaera chwakensis CCY0110 TaxID=391612 RepID=A3IY76_9CHRO|nr:hypothetical protein [Crocosphaera chwakensis]EAZ88559.1 Hsp33-like chaperonin [Crocosphaera chwakensis CCY0110]